MIYLPTSVSSYFAPHCQLAHRFSKGHVSLLENVTIRLQHLVKAVKALPEALFPEWDFPHNTGGLRAYMRSGGFRFNTHVKWVFSPSWAAQSAYKQEKHRIVWNVFCLALKGSVATAVTGLACIVPELMPVHTVVMGAVTVLGAFSYSNLRIALDIGRLLPENLTWSLIELSL